MLKSEMSFAEVIATIKWALVSRWQLFFNRFGLFGCAVLFCVLAMALLWMQKSQVSSTLEKLQLQLATQADSPRAPARIDRVDGHAKIKEFQQVLPAYSSIPNAIQDLLQLASEHDLSNTRGNYKARADADGGFLRYQMVIPVAGNIQSINQYIKSVLLAQKTLALENIKFKRDGVANAEIEARIQWVLFTRLPIKDETHYITYEE